MRAMMWTAAALVAGLAVVVPARAEDDAKKVVELAIKAHGGMEKLTQNKDRAVVQKGKLKIFDPIEADGTFEATIAGGKFRREVQFSIMGNDIKQVTIFDGNAMYI